MPGYYLTICLCLLFSFGGGCAQQHRGTNTGQHTVAEPMDETTPKPGLTSGETEPFPYDLFQPDHESRLPGDLIEVSGLGYAGNNRLVLVQDEWARIYIFDIEGDSVEGHYPFGIKGDFEGIEMAGESVFVLRSDGILFRVDSYQAETPEVTKYSTPIEASLNPEGLGLGPDGQLLIIGKEEPVINDEKLDDKRVIFSFDREKGELNPEPFTLVDMTQIQAKMYAGKDSDKAKEWLEDFEPEKAGSFKPSALAVHPITGEIYITASAGKMLVVLDKDLQVKHARYLPRGTFQQPEGICFDPEGNMYISNEGRDGVANILRFQWKN